jgi:asparagine synthase (glutamine-hydrolysing)
MCGINGIFAFGPRSSPADRNELRAVRDHMAARGPDGAGEWYSGDGRVALGHRRLSIIDLSERGAQPMTSADGQLVITFNGEIYNYRELRRELEAAGCAFRSDSDTEVLIHLYALHGQAMLTRLRGMFAFALWDARKGALLLARDTFGIKPIYYAAGEGTLRFASQVKALVAGGQVDTRPRAAGHVGFFLFGSVPSPWTLYRGVRSVPAGHFVWVTSAGANEPEPFSTVPDILAQASGAPARGTASDALEAIGAALRESIAAHHVADVPVGLFLSSGIDSSVIAALSTARGERPQTLTLAFKEYEGTGDDEAPLASQLAAQLGTRHSTVRIERKDFESNFDALLAAMDQPSIDGINSWFVARAATQQGIKVALSGLGGDELFGSYPSFHQLPLIRNLTRPLAPFPAVGRWTRKVSAPVLARITSPKYASLLEHGTSLAGAYLLRRGLFMPWELDAVLDADLAREGLQELGLQERLDRITAPIRHDNIAVSALEMSWYTRHQLLTDTDWASMAHSLEVRVPFLDVPLLRAVAPWLAAHPQLTKAAIAKAVAPNLPATLLNKKKTGFSVPVRTWLTKGKAHAGSRGLRDWSHVVYRQAADCQPAGNTAALWSPEMATPGGVQNYMWRLWEMLAQAASIRQPPKGLSLMDTPAALSAWTHPIAARPRGASQGKVKFTCAALLPRNSARSVIVGHVHHAPIAWLARWVGNIDRYFVVLHGIEAWQRLPLHQRVALRSADAVVATTHYTARTCAEANGLPMGNFKVIPLCADPAPSAADAGFALAGQFTVLFVGRLATGEKYKGLETLIQAIGDLVQKGIPAALHVIGDGDDRERLTETARRAGLDGSVFFHGRVSDAKLQAAYASASVFAMPSAKEGFGIVFLEAMRHGVVCIGGAHGGTPEVFKHGDEGLLVTYGDVAALSGHLERLARDPGARQQLARAGQRRFEQDYTFQAFAGRWEALLQPGAERAG